MTRHGRVGQNERGLRRGAATHQLECREPKEEELLARLGRSLRWSDGDVSTSLAPPDPAWREHVRTLERSDCRRLRVELCGRPLLAFTFEVDASRHVAPGGPLISSGD
jgi:hypothetical protein